MYWNPHLPPEAQDWDMEYPQEPFDDEPMDVEDRNED